MKKDSVRAMSSSVESRTDDLLKLASDIVSAYVSNNPVPANELPAMIKNVHATLGSLAGAPPSDSLTSQKPAVPVNKSISAEYIVCLEDGKKLKMLKRYLRSNYNLTPEEYRAKWKLPRDYPMVAPAYAEQRRALAKQIGLARKPAETPPAAKAKTASKAAAGPKAAAAS